MSLIIGIVAPGPIQRVVNDLGGATGAGYKDADQPMRTNATRKGGSWFQISVFVCSLYQTQV